MICLCHEIQARQTLLNIAQIAVYLTYCCNAQWGSFKMIKSFQSPLDTLYILGLPIYDRIPLFNWRSSLFLFSKQSSDNCSIFCPFQHFRARNVSGGVACSAWCVPSAYKEIYFQWNHNLLHFAQYGPSNCTEHINALELIPQWLVLQQLGPGPGSQSSPITRSTANWHVYIIGIDLDLNCAYVNIYMDYY